MLIMPLWQQVVRNVPGEPTGGGAPADPPADPAAATPADPSAQPTAPDLSWLPESFRKDDGVDIDGFRTHYEDMVAAQAALADQQGQLPQSADEYDLTPGDIDFGEIQVPDWFKFEIDPEHPVVGELKGFLHEHRLPASTGQALMGMLARYEAAKAAQFAADADAAKQSLGPQYEARMSKIQRALETRVRDPKQREALLLSITSAEAFRGLESFVSGVSAAPPPSAHSQAATQQLRPFDKLRLANSQAAG